MRLRQRCEFSRAEREAKPTVREPGGRKELSSETGDVTASDSRADNQYRRPDVKRPTDTVRPQRALLEFPSMQQQQQQ